jgi:hypothetical protein
MLQENYTRTKKKNQPQLTSILNTHTVAFESVVAVVFQSVFHSEMYQNNIFLFLKNYF